MDQRKERLLQKTNKEIKLSKPNSYVEFKYRYYTGELEP